MKYAQLLIGLLAGTALGGAVVAATGKSTVNDPEAIKAIVRQVISEEPKLLIDSVEKFQFEQQRKMQSTSNEVLKDQTVRDKIFNDPAAASVGPKDSKRVVAEFFDYNCGACKFMFKGLQELLAKDKSVRVVFHEFPIFGPTSETNSRIGIAVNRLYPEKYYDFHVKMMSAPGHADEKAAYGFIKELGMDEEKVKTEAAKQDITNVFMSNRALGELLRIQGTPTLVIGNEVVPHALNLQDLTEKLDQAAAAPSPAPEAKPEGENKDIPAVNLPAPEAAETPAAVKAN